MRRRTFVGEFDYADCVDDQSTRIDNVEAHIAELLGQLRTLERMHAWLDPVRDSVTRGFLRGCSMDLRRQAREWKLLLEKVTHPERNSAAITGRGILPVPVIVYFS
jgi:hypothetical protein